MSAQQSGNHNLSKKSLALFAKVLATYTHSELSNLFMLFGIEDRAATGSNKLARAMGVVSEGDKEPSLKKHVVELLLHVLDDRDILTRRSRGELDQTALALVESLEMDELILPTPPGSAPAGLRVGAVDSRTTDSAVPLGSSRPDSGNHKEIASYSYDFFISHASEDKDAFARPLADELTARGLRIWYDEFSLDIGDSLRESIDFGLGSSQYGVVILSKAFFAKEWPRKELNGLDAMQRDGRKVILPIWHGVDESEVRRFSPMLADRVAAKSTRGAKGVADALERILGRHRIVAKATNTAAPVEPGKLFRSHLRAPNSQAWAVVVVGAVPEGSGPLDDEAQDVIQASFLDLWPSAQCERQTDDYASWVDRGPDNIHSLWIGEVFPGPVVVMMRAMEATTTPQGSQIVMSQLVAWWIKAASAARRIVNVFGVDDVVVGLAFNPYPAAGPPIDGIVFGDLPPSQRVAAPHMIPPWEFQGPVTTTDRMTDDLTAAAASLLKVYSYRRLDATLSAIRERLTGETPNVAESATDAAETDESGTGEMLLDNDLTIVPIRLVRVVTDEVTVPRLDGTQGSALYRVPIELSRRPSARWAELFIQAWDHPSKFTLMHRPRIASVVDDRIVLDGTTLDEVKDYHRDTLVLAVEAANKQIAADQESERAAADREAERRRQHELEVRRAAEEIKFD